MRTLLLLFVAFCAGSAWAQTHPSEPLGKVKAFLTLSDSQVQTILRNNDDYNRWAREKQDRIWTLMREILAETARESPDAIALGSRYLEIETNCREMKAKATDFQKRNVDVLTDPQKAKLKVLDDALKLFPTATEGEYANLLGTFTIAPSGFTGSSSVSGFSSSGGYAAVSGCQPFGPIGTIIGGNTWADLAMARNRTVRIPVAAGRRR